MQSNRNYCYNIPSLIRVRTPIEPEPDKLPDGTHYNFVNRIHSVTYIFRNPTLREIDAVRKGTAEFALVKYRDILLFLSKFGDLNWADAPYSWWINPPELRTLPEQLQSPQARILLPVKLVNSATGVTMAVRATTLSPEFTRVLYREIEDQANRPEISRVDYDKQIDSIFALFKTKQLLPLACARCIGGMP